MPDGAKLPLYTWSQSSQPRAILLAVHGFNDYGKFIEEAAKFFREQGVKIYAYDQRGFGRAPYPGFWPGTAALCQDLFIITKLLRERHQGVPIYLLGHSMGGAVLISALSGNKPPLMDGVILAAPAVWGRETMPFYQRWLLQFSVSITPWLKLSGRGLNIKPSDNIDMLKKLGQDSLIIKETRVDAIWGLVNLMDVALESAKSFDMRALILLGDNDQVINETSVDLFLSRRPSSAKLRQKINRYNNGHHMLLRDLNRKRVWKDILDWMFLEAT